MKHYPCKECGKKFSQKTKEELIEKAKSHMRIDHGKTVGREKIIKRIKD